MSQWWHGIFLFNSDRKISILNTKGIPIMIKDILITFFTHPITIKVGSFLLFAIGMILIFKLATYFDVLNEFWTFLEYLKVLIIELKEYLF